VKFHGITLEQGSTVVNLTVASGTSFPNQPHEGELFFRSGEDPRVTGLYMYAGGSWDRIASTDSLTAPKGVNLPALANEGDLFYLDSNTASEGLYIFKNAEWASVTAGSIPAFTITGDVTGTIDGGTDALTLTTTGVNAGTYKSVTVDAKGRVTAGTNPTTLAGYGITDAQSLDADLTAIAGLVGTSGLLRKTAADTWSLDTNTYLTGNQSISLSGDAAGSGTTAITVTLASVNSNAGTFGSATSIPVITVDAKGRVTAVSTSSLDADLTAIAGLTGTSGLLRKTATDTWSLDTNTYLTGNQTITLSGDATGSGTTAITVALANSGVTAGTFRSVTVDAKGRVTAGTNPTTLAGYGITDAQPLDADLTALSNIAQTGLYVITAAGSSDVRTLTAPASGITITNANGVSGNPTFALANDLAAVEALTGTGIIRRTAADTWSAGTAVSLTTEVSGILPIANGGTNASTADNARINLGLAIGTNVQAWDADLDAIAAIAATSGLLRKTAANTWSLDTNTYLTGNQSISFSGDATGSGTTAVTLTLANSGVTAGSYGSASNVSTFTVDSKGRLTAAGSTSIAIAASQVTSGTFADAHISQSSVTQHQGALSIAETQIADGTTLARLAANETVTGTWTFNNPVTVGAPTSDNHAATKLYVDNVVSGLDYKQSVKAATTANITLSGTQTIDGVSLIAGDRVLVKNQTTASQNGIYVVATGAWPRSSDANSDAEVTSGMYVFVEQGTTQADSGWILSTEDPLVLGTTALSFTQFNGLGQLIAGAGLTKNGNTLDVGTASTGRIVVNADSIDLATAGTAGTYRSVTTDAYGRVTAGTNPTTLAGYGITDAQPLDADLTAIAGLAGTSGVLRKTAADTWTLDTNTYLTGNQTVTFSGDATGSGTTAVTLTLANSGATAGTYNSVTVDAKGRVTSGTNSITGTGTTYVTNTSPTISGATLNGTTVLPDGAQIRAWSSSNTDIDGLISGTTAGILFESPTSYHFTIGLRSNDVDDGFQVISKGAATSPSTDPYISKVFEVKANGNVSWLGNADSGGYLSRTTVNGNSAWMQQDGIGRSHWYWNTFGGTTPTFTNAGEDASALTLHVTNNGNGGTLSHRSASGVGKNAGDPITWTQTLYVDLNTLTWKGNVILRADNYNSYAPTLTGTGASGTWGINVTGSAGSVSGGSGLFADGSVTAPSISFSADTNTGIYRPAADVVGITTGGTERMRITSAGNVGIGTTGPNSVLDIYRASATNVYVTTGNTTASWLTGVAAGGDYDIYSNNASNIKFSNNGSERARIDSTGKVGIGTTSPGARLHVSGSGNEYILAHTTDTTGARIGYVGAQYSNSSTIQMRAGLGYTYLVSTAATDPMLFGTNGQERMRIDSTGNVGIGTTSPVGKLDIVTGTNRGYFDDSAGSLFRLNAVNAANSAYAPLSLNGSVLTFQIAASERMRITSAGNVGIGTSSPLTELNVPNSILVTNDGGYYGGGAYFASGSWRNAVTGQGGFAIRNSTGTFTLFTGSSTSAAGTAFSSFGERMRVTGDGSVGIGTNAPAATLDVTRPAAASTNFTAVFANGTNNRANGYFGFLSRAAAGSWSPLVAENDQAMIFSGGSLDTGALVIAQHSSSARGIKISSTGAVGIGINPSYTLDVNGTAGIRGNLGVSEAAGGGNRLIISSGAGGAVFNQNDNSGIFFQTEGVTRAWISYGTNDLTVTGGIKAGTSAPTFYQTLIDFGDAAAGTWRRLVVASLTNHAYSTVGFKIDIVDPNANHAVSTTVDSVETKTYYVACVRTETETLNAPDACYVRGPANLIRAVKTSQGNYEIQLQNENQWREYQVTVQVYAINGAHTITYEPATTVGSSGTVYTATAGNAKDWFQQIQATGTITAASFSGAGTGLTGNATSLSIGGNAQTATSASNLTGGNMTGDYQVTSGIGIRFGHANQTDNNDGWISAAKFASGLNIVGTQTSAATGRQVRIWGSLIDSSGIEYVRNTGSWSINASTATTLQTARTINGTSFNGSQNITTANWGTARTITIGSTGKSVDGSGNVSWTLTEIGAQASLGFTPVQQGGGTSQLTNKLYIGWSAAGNLRLQVDSSDFGSLWPINIAGDSATTSGLSVHTARNNEANKIVRTDANGYIQAGWINTSSGDSGTTAIDRVYASYDGYIRYYTPANFRTVLDVPTRTGSGASGTWSINVTGSAGSLNGGSGLFADGSVSSPSISFANDTNTGIYRIGNDVIGITTGGTIATEIDANGNTTIYGGISRSGSISRASWTTIGCAFDSAVATFTDTSSAASSTVTARVANSFRRPTFASTNTGVTITDAATLYVQNSPLAGTNTTITNTYAILVNAGTSKFDGILRADANLAATSSTTGSIRVTGGIGLTGALYAGGDVTAFSDRRVKGDLEVIQNALQKVQSINGYTYTRTDQEDNQKRHAGVIAQEVEAVLPEVVTTDPETGMKGVAYGNMVALLIQSIKELSASVDELKATNAQLKAQLDQLASAK